MVIIIEHPPPLQSITDETQERTINRSNQYTKQSESDKLSTLLVTLTLIRSLSNSTFTITMTMDKHMRDKIITHIIKIARHSLCCNKATTQQHVMIT